MTALWFYHLERSPLEAALPPLLEKCLQRGWRAVVRGALPERLESLDTALWAWKDESFLPHGLEGRDAAERQPILLTTAATSANGAKALFLLDGAEPGDISLYERASVVFDGRDEAAVVHARLQWKTAKEAGQEIAYWKESAAGRWEKHA